jgi:hypothetical protein
VLAAGHEKKNHGSNNSFFQNKYRKKQISFLKGPTGKWETTGSFQSSLLLLFLHDPTVFLNLLGRRCGD